MNLGKLATVAALCAALAGCATGTKPPSSASVVFALAGSYTETANAEAAYLALPACPTSAPLCYDPVVKPIMKHYSDQAFQALQPVVLAAQNGTAVDAVELEAAQAAVKALSDYVATHKVN